jgi:hypothetical protein
MIMCSRRSCIPEWEQPFWKDFDTPRTICWVNALTSSQCHYTHTVTGPEKKDVILQWTSFLDHWRNYWKVHDFRMYMSIICDKRNSWTNTTRWMHMSIVRNLVTLCIVTVTIVMGFNYNTHCQSTLILNYFSLIWSHK